MWWMLAGCDPAPRPAEHSGMDWSCRSLDGCAWTGSLDTGAEPCTAAPMGMDCGTGELAYEALVSGASVTMVHGEQGGWHVWTAAQTAHSLQVVALLPTITVGDLVLTQNTAPGDFVALSYDAETCDGAYYGQRAYLDPSRIDADPAHGQQVICGLVGQTARLRLDLTEPDTGRTTWCAVEVVLAADPGDQPACDGG